MRIRVDPDSGKKKLDPDPEKNLDPKHWLLILKCRIQLNFRLDLHIIMFKCFTELKVPFLIPLTATTALKIGLRTAAGTENHKAVLHRGVKQFNNRKI